MDVFSEQRRECVEIDRLDQVVIEPGCAGAAAVFFLAVTRDGDDHRILARIIVPEGRRDLVAVHAREADIEQNEIRPERPRRFNRRLAVEATWTSFPRSLRSRAIPPAVSTLSSTTRMREPSGTARGRLPRDGAVVCGLFAAGREMTNSLPLSVPSLAGRDVAAVHLGELPDDGEPDAQAPFRAGDGTLALREELEHVGQFLGRNADAVVAHRDDDVVSFPRGGQPDSAPALGVLRGVCQQVDDDLLDPRRVGPDRECLAARTR